jgi:hypothetical protein
MTENGMIDDRPNLHPNKRNERDGGGAVVWIWGVGGLGALSEMQGSGYPQGFFQGFSGVRVRV